MLYDNSLCNDRTSPRALGPDLICQGHSSTTPIQVHSQVLTSTLPLRLTIRKRKSRRPLISPRLPTNFPMTARKKKTPKPNTSRNRIPKHPHRKRRLSVKRIPGVRIERTNPLEDRRHHQRGDGVGCFGVRFVGCHSFGDCGG